LAEGTDDLPCSLILLQKDDQDHTRVIGHSRLNQVLGKPEAVFLTCVLIEKTLRGHGLGKKLMQLTEKYASQLGCTAIYLTTFEKYEFYKHLGYQCCSQVSSVKARSSLFTSSQLALLQGQFGEREPQIEEREEGKFVDSSSGNSVINNQELSDDTIARQEGRSIVHNQKINTGLNDPDKQGEMCNNSSLLLGEATASPLPPTPPPPPPPPALKPPTSQIRSILTNPVWMMKEMQHDNH